MVNGHVLTKTVRSAAHQATFSAPDWLALDLRILDDTVSYTMWSPAHLRYHTSQTIYIGTGYTCRRLCSRCGSLSTTSCGQMVIKWRCVDHTARPNLPRRPATRHLSCDLAAQQLLDERVTDGGLQPSCCAQGYRILCCPLPMQFWHISRRAAAPPRWRTAERPGLASKP